MLRGILILLGIFLFTSCTLNMNIDEMVITNEMCQDLIEKFGEDGDDDYVPVDYGCSGYALDEENNECLTECFEQEDCDLEHYCDYVTSTCELKGIGPCEGDDQCRSGLCLCDMCMSLF